MLTVAWRSPKPLVGVQIPGGEPNNGIVSVMVAPKFVELVARDRYSYGTPVATQRWQSGPMQGTANP